MDWSYCPKQRYIHLPSKDHGVVLSNADVSSKEWDTFLTVAQGLARRTAHKCPNPLNPTVVVGESQVPNAFA